MMSTERQNRTVIFQSFVFPTRQPSGRQANNSAGEDNVAELYQKQYGCGFSPLPCQGGSFGSILILYPAGGDTHSCLAQKLKAGG
ncbi:MAG: hypothetical protein ABSC89_10325 [Verrucomicrobiota bacterium]|jgi:hypothetical protein